MNADKYSSLAALKEHLGEDVFRARVLNRAAQITIIAPHGGFIEPGTSAIARAIAGKQWNYFDFQGLQRENGLDLHITATNFRHPLLTPMLKRSIAAVSMHCMFEQGTKDIWLGGLNLALKACIEARLAARSFTVNPNPPHYRGESTRNVVNLPPEHGTQLELSSELMAELFVKQPFLVSGRKPRTTKRFDQLVLAVREGINDYDAQVRRRRLDSPA
jgi:phage replication-related protein YjqB (UPF0714/DUF867 family)